MNMGYNRKQTIQRMHEKSQHKREGAKHYA